MEVRFTVPGCPVAQPRPRARNMGKHATVYAAEKSHPIHAFKATVKLAARRAYHGEPTRSPVAVNLVFVLPRPASKVWKTKPMPRIRHTGRPDLDNAQKSLLDSLTSVIFHDDAQVWQCFATKFIAAGDEQPHTEIAVRFK